jgi:hypothetical protein
MRLVYNCKQHLSSRSAGQPAPRMPSSARDSWSFVPGNRLAVARAGSWSRSAGRTAWQARRLAQAARPLNVANDSPESQTGSQGQQGPGSVRRRQAIVIAGQRRVGRRWALPGPVRVCLLSSRPQVRVLLGAPYQQVENIFRHSVQGYVNCLCRLASAPSTGRGASRNRQRLPGRLVRSDNSRLPVKPPGARPAGQQATSSEHATRGRSGSRGAR